MIENVTKPIRTVTADGKEISVDLRENKNPIKTLDNYNRVVETATPAEITAATNTALDTLGANTGIAPPATVGTSETEVTTAPVKNADAEARKLLLKAQKAERRALEMEKKAAAGLAKADAIEKAISLAKSGEDPTALIKAAGLDMAEYYQAATKYALSDKNQKPEDPKDKMLREHEEQLKKYAEDNQKLADSIKNKEEVEWHNNVITQEVIPIFTQNPDKYEALRYEFGDYAATEVYKTVWDRHKKLGHTLDDEGKQLTFERVADILEDFYTKQIESGINVAYNMKKFSSWFTQPGSEQKNQTNQGKVETPNKPFTLSNKHSPPQATIKKIPAREGEGFDERIERLKKQYGF